MKKRGLSLFLAALIVLIVIPTAAAQTGGSVLAEWNYTIDEEAGTVTLTKYIGGADAVAVPAGFEVEGRNYAAVLASQTVFRGNTGLKSVTIGAGVGFLNNSLRLLFGDCTALTAVDLSAVNTSGVVRMDYMFYNCSALKTADLSAIDAASVTNIRAIFSGCTNLSGLTGYENWNTSSLENMSFAFNKFVQSVSASVRVTIDLRNWDLSHLNNSGWCFQNCRAQQILLPDNLVMMSAGFLNHATRYEGTSFTVPAGVKKIGYAHTLYDFATDDLTEIRVAEGNTYYKAVDGVLYSADGKEMLAVPRNKPFESGVFEIPEGVDFLGELSFSRNYNIHTVVLPDSYEIEYVPIYADRYIIFEDSGNLNAGTNLSIAIYCYTGITDYAVKDTNPRYASADGIIYSKDMRHVVAVPARYNKAMRIPEGVTHWDKEAMWADGSSTVDNLLANCSGVVIPSTLKEIANDQFAMLNRLYSARQNTSNPFTITVAEGNTAFYLNEDGALCRSFTVTWKNWDGKVLKTEVLPEGATPVYAGETPTRPEDNAFTYTFAGWNTEPAAVRSDAVYTATFSKTEKTEQKDWQSVTIADQISINFLLNAQLHEDMQSITITYTDQDQENKTLDVDVSKLVVDEESGCYRVPAVVAPAQIGGTVTITIVEKNGDTTKTTTYETSIAKYCEYLIDRYRLSEDEYEKNVMKLAKATLEYGEAANEYFAYGASFAGTETAQNSINRVKTEVNPALSVESNGKVTGVSFMVLTQPEFRFYTSLTEEEAIELNKKINVTTGNAKAQFVRNVDTGAIMLEVTGIEAANMNQKVKITIGDWTIEFCGNDFAWLLVQDSTTAVLGAALYNYGLAAQDCFPAKEG